MNQVKFLKLRLARISWLCTQQNPVAIIIIIIIMIIIIIIIIMSL
jgi:hypothetical protein